MRGVLLALALSTLVAAGPANAMQPISAPKAKAADALFDKGVAAIQSGRYLEARDQLGEAFDIHKRQGPSDDAFAVALALSYANNALTWWYEAGVPLRWILDNATSRNDPDGMRMAAAHNLAGLALTQGRTAEARSWYERAQAFRASGVSGGLAPEISMLLEGELLSAEGRLVDAEVHLNDLCASLVQPSQFGAACRQARARNLLRMGHPSRALEIFSETCGEYVSLDQRKALPAAEAIILDCGMEHLEFLLQAGEPRLVVDTFRLYMGLGSSPDRFGQILTKGSLTAARAADQIGDRDASDGFWTFATIQGQFSSCHSNSAEESVCDKGSPTWIAAFGGRAAFETDVNGNHDRAWRHSAEAVEGIWARYPDARVAVEDGRARDMLGRQRSDFLVRIRAGWRLSYGPD